MTDESNARIGCVVVLVAVVLTALSVVGAGLWLVEQVVWRCEDTHRYITERGVVEDIVEMRDCGFVRRGTKPTLPTRRRDVPSDALPVGLSDDIQSRESTESTITGGGEA